MANWFLKNFGYKFYCHTTGCLYVTFGFTIKSTNKRLKEHEKIHALVANPG